MRARSWPVLVLALGLLAPASGRAHTASTYYPNRWQTTSQVWNFTQGFPTGAFRTRVRDGVAQWNNIGANFRFNEGGQVANYSSTTCPTSGRNGVHYRTIDGSGGTLAETLMCFGAGAMSSANIAFDSQESWYTATLVPTGSQRDAWSVATHEWGHATGFYGPYANGHFNPAESICTAGSPQTMCPTYVPPTATDPKMRTVSGHDTHTFSAAYPVPPPPSGPVWTTGFSSLGAPPTGGLTSGPDAASWEPGRLDVFVRGTGNRLEHKFRTPSGGWVSSWESPNLGAPTGLSLAGDPTAASWGPGRVDVFARATDNNLWHRFYNGQWSAWENLGAPLGGLASDPDVSSRTTNSLDVFALGLTGTLYQKSWTGSSWTGWTSLGKPATGGLTSHPSAVSWDAGRIDVFARGPNSHLFHRWWTSSAGWSVWENLCAAPHPGCYLFSAPDVSSWSAGRLDVFIAGDTAAPHRLYHRWYNGSWSGWENLCAAPHSACDIVGAPGAVSWGLNRIDVFVRGNTNQLYVKSFGVQ
jgi:hypothetical protein